MSGLSEMSNLPLIPLVFFLGLFLALLIGYFIGRIEKGSSSVAPPSPPALLRLFLDAEQKPRLEMDGVLLAEPLTAEQRRRLIALLNLIRPWLEGSVSKAAPTPAAPSPSSHPPSSGSSSTSTKLPASPSRESDLPEKPAGPMSIIAQIDAVLQELLQRKGIQRAIHLSEGADGSVQVVVDLRLYKSIEEVPEQEIQHLIRQAVAEWERRK